MNSTPVSLLERLRRPAEEAAWSRFVQLYTPLLFTWARRRGCREADAADLVQEVLTLLVRKLPAFRYDQHQSFRGWLRTVAHHRWQNLGRRAELPKQLPAPDLNELADPADDAFWETDYRRHLAQRALALMQADFQTTTWQACWECVVQGRSASDVARSLGISVGAVRMAKARVLSRLRQELEGLLD